MSVPRFAETEARPRALDHLRSPASASRPSAWLAFQPPVLTTGLLLVMLLIFAAEQYFSLDATAGFGLSAPTLTAVGALDRTLAFGQGEWWRIATAPLLHANLAHIVGNGLVLLFIGATLERLVGRAWLAALFVVSALGGALGGLLLNPVDLPSVGASGAIMGLLGAAFVLSFHPEAYGQRRRLRWIVAFLAIPALIPTAAAPGAPMLVDYSCHFGGVITGVVAGFLLQMIWPENAPHPLFSGFAAKLGMVGLGAAAAAFGAVALHYPDYAARGQLLMPEAETPKTVAEGASQSAQILARYPHDPRAHLYRAAYFESFQDWRDAEAQVRAAISDPVTAPLGLSPSFKLQMQFELAALLEDQGREDEARTAAQPVCALQGSAPWAQARAQLQNAGLCDQPG
jgi:rhomboid protease GluP